jgi:D-glycero-D-manno-heptose 1,7-bisphosphate phosphatase
MPVGLAAVFLDRDGVLNTHLPGAYVQRPSELVLLPAVAQAVRKLNDAHVPVVIISNQQGVGKKLMTQADLDEVDKALRDELFAQGGAKIDRSYYCPHLESDVCDCRKPKPGLIHQAIVELGVKTSDAAFIGDSETDMAAADAGGVGRKILVLSGATKHYRPGQFKEEPDIVLQDLPAAVDWLLNGGSGK